MPAAHALQNSVMLVVNWQQNLNFVLTFTPFRIDIARGEEVVASINRPATHSWPGAASHRA